MTQIDAPLIGSQLLPWCKMAQYQELRPCGNAESMTIPKSQVPRITAEIGLSYSKGRGRHGSGGGGKIADRASCSPPTQARLLLFCVHFFCYFLILGLGFCGVYTFNSDIFLCFWCFAVEIFFVLFCFWVCLLMEGSDG